jgi:hypothetical protein
MSIRAREKSGKGEGAFLKTHEAKILKIQHQNRSNDAGLFKKTKIIKFR